MLKIKDFGVCNLAVVPVRASNSDEAEIVTQLLFGDLVEVLEKGQPWIKIRFEADDYEGWMDFKQLTYIDEAEYIQLKSTAVAYLTQPQLTVEGPNGKQHLLFGSRLTGLHNNALHFGGMQYKLPATFTNAPSEILESAFYYLNTPYLWGGKSLFGIDCSGIVQNVFKAAHIHLPRDASKQVLKGELVQFEERQKGDVPFFINGKGKVHHVGILTQKDEIIHAAGCVRLDVFDEEGIFRKDLATYTHRFHSIRRFNLEK